MVRLSGWLLLLVIVSPGEWHRGAGHGASREPGAAPRRLTGMTSGSRAVHGVRSLPVTW